MLSKLFSNLDQSIGHLENTLSLLKGTKEMFEPAWIKIALQEVGQYEIPGATSNPRILEYHATTSLKASNDDVPWCSSFVNWVMKQAGYEGTNNAASLSWAAWGQRLTRPAYGSIVVFNHGNGKGHVGFLLGKTAKGYAILGGNQDNQVKVSVFNQTPFAFVAPFAYSLDNSLSVPVWQQSQPTVAVSTV